MMRHSILLSTLKYLLIIMSILASRVMYLQGRLFGRGILDASTEIYKIGKNLLFHVERPDARQGWRSARASNITY